MTPLDRSRLELTFSDEFDRDELGPDWKTQLWFGTQRDAHSRYHRDKKHGDELQIYSDPEYNGIDPFGLWNDQLVIQAAPLSKWQREDPKNGGRTYSSGIITTEDRFQQRYGYFCAKVALPQEPGVFPAVWLLQVPDYNQRTTQICPEIDIVETIGDDPKLLHLTAHWEDAAGKRQQRGGKVPGQATHYAREYGVLWTRETITWYLDGKPIYEMANPGIHGTAYILVNLAIGGWANPKGFPGRARMEVDYVRAYRIKG